MAENNSPLDHPRLTILIPFSGTLKLSANQVRDSESSRCASRNGYLKWKRIHLMPFLKKHGGDGRKKPPLKHPSSPNKRATFATCLPPSEAEDLLPRMVSKGTPRCPVATGLGDMKLS